MIRQCFILITLLISSLFLGVVHADNQLLKKPDVQAFIQYMVTHYQFKQTELEAIFRQVRPMPEIIHHMKHPAEANPWDTYQKLFVTEKRVHGGNEFWEEHRSALKEAENNYHVPTPIIIAILGIESNYGTHIMKYRAIDALTNLAFNYPSRQTFFQSQLQSFLLLVKKHHLNIDDIYGSYAGAIGPAQFMPESILRYAVISNMDLNLRNPGDWINSISNYFIKKGWQPGKPLATAIVCPTTTPSNIIPNSLKNFYTPQQLRAAGIANNSQEPAMFIQLQSSKGRECWLGYSNFAVIMHYNTSPLYAMAVVQLSSKLSLSEVV